MPRAAHSSAAPGQAGGRRLPVHVGFRWGVLVVGSLCAVPLGWRNTPCTPLSRNEHPTACRRRVQVESQGWRGESRELLGGQRQGGGRKEQLWVQHDPQRALWRGLTGPEAPGLGLQLFPPPGTLVGPGLYHSHLLLSAGACLPQRNDSGTWCVSGACVWSWCPGSAPEGGRLRAGLREWLLLGGPGPAGPATGSG